MNFLTKTIPKRGLFSTSSTKKCQLLLQTITPLQQSSSRFASTTRKPKIQKPQEPLSSYTLTPPRIEKNEQEKLHSWPKPSEIPYQSKVANSVNLVGFVQTPVQFESSLDGKYFAGTVIVNESSNNDDKDSVLMVPVVFMGDLAHVVACHVKLNDCVYVSGKFSIDPLPFDIMDGYVGSFHIVAENVNFVQGLKRKENLVFPKSKERSDAENVNLAALESDDSVNLGRSKSGLENEDSGNLGRRKLGGGDEWRDLIKNPKEWWDCRKAKVDGVVKARHPDFKKKDSSISLWLENVLSWVHEGLEGLEFDVYVPKSKGVGKEVDSWKDLVENPDKWWDNRATKLNQKAPDFKHKNTGIGLWLSSSPDWVLSRLPPLRDQQAASSYK